MCSLEQVEPSNEHLTKVLVATSTLSRSSETITNVADLVKVDSPDPFRLHLGHHEVGVAPAPVSEHMGYLR